MRFALGLLFACCCAAQPPGDLRNLVRESLSFLDPARNQADEYAYSFRTDRKELDPAGAVKAQETVLGQRSFLSGHVVTRVLERNGKKLSPQESRRQEAKIERTVAELNALSPAERRARRQKELEKQAWLREIADALDYRYLGEEVHEGRPTYLLACFPRPGYSAKHMRARVFEKSRGKLWIDKADRELVRAEAETFDAVNVGFGLVGKIEKGTRFALVRKRLPEGAWLLDSQTIRFAARFLLLKQLSNEIVIRHWGYRHKSELRAAAPRAPRP